MVNIIFKKKTKLFVLTQKQFSLDKCIHFGIHQSQGKP